MKILGIKYTHDSSIALIEDNKLIFSVENEKINNGDRYKKSNDLYFAEEILKNYGLCLEDINVIVIDGWIYNGNIKIESDKIKDFNFPVAKYYDYDSDLTVTKYFDNKNFLYEYCSYPHILGHIIGTYCTSKFADHKIPVYSLVFDGNQPPRIDIVNPNSPVKVKFIDHCHIFSGSIYGIMGYYYGPYKDEAIINKINVHSRANKLFHNYGIPGKLMSYIGLGKISKELMFSLNDMYIEFEKDVLNDGLQNLTHNFRGYIEHYFMYNVMKLDTDDLSDADVLLTIHTFLEKLLVNRLTQLTTKGMSLIYSGGSALNIKWNTAILESDHYKEVFVPPFANDTGSALGMAACYNAIELGNWNLDWSVYCGPELIVNKPSNKWKAILATTKYVGELLAYNKNMCIVCLHGKSEIGPRSLGHRSILMSPVSEENKQKLNEIKKRESFRPVAPITLKEDAYKYFDLITEDKYMLYDHFVKEKSKNIIPAIVHVDDTSRVQVIDEKDSEFIFEILKSFKNVTGIGVLCNTSANYNGKGFFPDIKSATEWAEENDVYYVYANNTLYIREKND